MTKEKFIRVPLVELPINAEVAKSIMREKESGFYFSIQEDLAGHKSYSLWSVYPTTKDGVSTKLEYLIKTYTNEGDLVLDNTMGSGSTGVACVNLKRKFVGIELDEGYYHIACSRIEDAMKNKQQELFK